MDGVKHLEAALSSKNLIADGQGGPTVIVDLGLRQAVRDEGFAMDAE
jgi:hypothetical protein